MTAWRKSSAPVRVYRFHAEPLEPIPDAIWERAQTMRSLWNRWVAMRREIRDTVHAHPNLIDHADWWKQFTACRKQDASALGIPQNWHWALQQRFSVACQEAPARRARAIANGANPVNPNLGEPSFQRRLETCCLPWYFGDQRSLRRCVCRSAAFRLDGLPDPSLYVGEHLRAPARLTGTFGIPGVAGFRFQAIPHRPVPETAILKHVEWVGKRSWNGEWEWGLCLFLEFPDGLGTIPPASRAAGLDVGWRRFPDYIRVGMLADTSGAVFEVRLPLDMSSYRTRRRQPEAVRQRLLYATPQPGPAVPQTWEQVYDLDGEIGRQVDAIKARIRALLDGCELLSPNITRMLSYLCKMRQGGIIRLQRELQQCEASEAADAVAAIADWLEVNERLRHLRNDASERMVRRRGDIYGQIAAWIAVQYDELRWEGQLEVQRMGQSSGEPALDNADRTRQIAAPSDFRSSVANVLIRCGRTITPMETAFSTRTCHICGSVCDGGPALTLCCPEGHQWDQDVNAALNLLGEIQVSGEPPIVPDALRRYLVRIQ